MYARTTRYCTGWQNRNEELKSQERWSQFSERSRGAQKLRSFLCPYVCMGRMQSWGQALCHRPHYIPGLKAAMVVNTILVSSHTVKIRLPHQSSVGPPYPRGIKLNLIKASLSVNTEIQTKLVSLILTTDLLGTNSYLLDTINFILHVAIYPSLQFQVVSRNKIQHSLVLNTSSHSPLL